MGTISSALSMTSAALDADQSALDVVANNVANANTPGYTEEVPTWQENDPVILNGLVSGTGVTEIGASSQRDRVLSMRLDQQQQLAAASGPRLTALNLIQSLFTVDSGSSSSTSGDIGNDLTSFFNSFSSLEVNPSSNSLRQAVLSSAATLASDVSGAAGGLASQKASLDQEAAGVSGQVNALTASIAQLNTQIESTSPHTDAGTLEDQREEDVSQLSRLLGINQITTENNGLSITTTGGVTLVSEGKSYQLATGSQNGVSHFFVGTDDVTQELMSGGGELGGYLTARDVDIASVSASLDELAYTVSTQVNFLNNSGSDLGGGDTSKAGNIFAPPAEVTGSAISMRVVLTDPNQIAAAGSGEGTGDSSNAAAIAALANASIVNGQTPNDYYASLVSALGATVAEASTENTALNASVTQLQTLNDSISSVNLNDEASAMTTLERSYQAASQVFSMLNTLIASVLNLGEQATVS
jgi:flagellar hook-associated protein 1 FlgK